MNLLVFGWREAFYVSYGRNNNQKSIINLVIISELLYQALTLLLIITWHPLPRAHIIIDFIHYFMVIVRLGNIGFHILSDCNE